MLNNLSIIMGVSYPGDDEDQDSFGGEDENGVPYGVPGTPPNWPLDDDSFWRCPLARDVRKKLNIE